MLRLLVDWQESDGQKTNNGIHYRLQLLYANGERPIARVSLIMMCGRAGLGRAGMSGDELRSKVNDRDLVALVHGE